MVPLHDAFTDIHHVYFIGTGQLYYCPVPSELPLNDMGNIQQY